MHTQSRVCCSTLFRPIPSQSHNPPAQTQCSPKEKVPRSCCRGPCTFPGSAPSHSHPCWSSALLVVLGAPPPPLPLHQGAGATMNTPAPGPPEVSGLLALGLPGRRGLAGKGRVRQAGGSCDLPVESYGPRPPHPPSSRITKTVPLSLLDGCGVQTPCSGTQPLQHDGESCSHFTDGETEARRRGGTRPRSHSSEVAKRGFEPKQALKRTEATSLRGPFPSQGLSFPW